MDFSRLISTMFHDKPGVMYENPPPPSDDFEYDFGSIFFTYPRPQNVPDMKFIKIDRSLIHKSLLGYEEKEEEQTFTESTRGDENRKGNENIEGIKAVKIVESSAEISVNKNALEKGIDKSNISKENLVKNGALEKKIKCAISQKNESAVFPEKNKEGKQKNQSKEEKKNCIDSDDSKGKKKKALVTKSSALQSISKSYSMSESDSDNSEKNITKSSSHQLKSHSKKSSRHRRKDSRNDTSCSDVIPYDKVGLRSAESSVKQEVISSDEESLSSSFSKKAEITVKEEVLSDKDDYKKDKMSSKGSKNCDDSRSRDDSKNHDDSKSCDDSRNQFEDSQSHDDARNHDDSRNHFDDSRSRDDTRNHDDSRKNHSDYSSDDDSRNRPYADSNGSRSLTPYMQREMKQEIKQEPGSANCLGPNDFYCDVCKLILNSETTFSSHMAGKRHKKALRQLSEQEVAKSSVLEITESHNFPRPSDVDRLELYDEQSRIQETCEDADLLIVGLDYVREIRGYEDTKYFCDLCSAQCVANSIIKHLIGFKHQMNCLKQYCCRSYNWVKDLDKRDKRVDRELKLQLEEAKRLHGKGRIRVFRDVKRNQRSPEPYNPYRPSTSRPVLLPGDVQGKKTDELTVTDEDCLSRDFSDFYCKVCDSHMNNYSMWESHARGKRHAKNKKKAPIGLVTNSNFVEAPHGTISHLEAMIYEQCGSNDIIVGLNFIRENQGENGDLYNCYLCGSVCPTIDIIDHLYLKKHKTKYLEKLLSDGYYNAINEISSLPIGETAREGLIDAECEKLMIEFGRGRPVICVTKNTFFRPPVLQNHKVKDPVGVGSFKNRKPPHVSGLDYIRETRGYVDTEYYYDPYNAQCVANSIIKNFLGFNHQINNLKKYCQESHHWVKDCDERDRRLGRELKFRLEESKWLHGNGKRRVFKDVQNVQKCSGPYNSYQPSISRQNLDIQNKKKAPKGLVKNINFTEAPPSKLSHLEEMIRKQCGPDDIIVGLNFLRENPGVNGHLYDCNLCGGVYHSMDILSHLSLKKHRTKYLEKMHSDGCHNAINEINVLPIDDYAKKGLIDEECEKMVKKYGRGRPIIGVPKKI